MEDFATMLRIGVVMALDEEIHACRVKFPDTDIISGFLPVLQHPYTKITLQPEKEHCHDDSYTTFWSPRINDTVLCVYEPIFNGDGYVIGVIP